MNTLYETLGVKAEASQDEIKNAYRNGANKLHPDKGGNKAEFSRIARAYGILKDPKKREHYDKTGSAENVSSFEQQANLMLSTMFNDILQKVGVEKILNHNVVGVIEKGLEGMSNKIEIEKRKIKESKKGLKKVLSRIKHKDKNNLFSSIVSQRINNLAISLESIKQQKEVVGIARKLLKDYDFKFDIAVVAAGAWSNNVSTSSMFTVTL